MRGPTGGAARLDGGQGEPQSDPQQSLPVQRAEAEARHANPKEHELLRRWCEGLGQEYRGQRLVGLVHEVFLKLLKAKREVPTAAQRQEVLAVQQGLCALCGCTVTQSACELDHVVPVRQLFADSVQGLCAGRVLQPRAPLTKGPWCSATHGAHAAVQRPERRARQEDSLLESQMQLGSLQYPHNPMKGASEHLAAAASDCARRPP